MHGGGGRDGQIWLNASGSDVPMINYSRKSVGWTTELMVKPKGNAYIQSIF